MGKEKHIIAEILDVGPGKKSLLSGEHIPTVLKKGLKVVLPRVGVTNLYSDGEEYIACDEGKVLAILED
jgi:co-chaperonin GroES (HSP10)